MKKVLFFIPSLGGGGAEKVLVTLINNLNSKKYQITLITLFNGGVNEKFLNDDIEIKTIFGKQFKGNIHLLKLFPPKFLYKYFIKEKYDVAISYLEGPTTRILSGNPYSDTTLMNWIHIEVNDENMLLPSYIGKRDFFKTHNKYSHTIFVSNTALHAFEKTFPNLKGNYLVKYNTVDHNNIKNKSLESVEDICINQEKFNLVSVGRFTKQKGYKRLLSIIKKLKNDKIDFHLYLLGKGEEERDYKNYIEENELEDYITIIGFRDNPYKYIAKCDLFVCSSYEEGYSTAVTESLILQVPVITTLCSGMQEILGYQNEYGIITENNEESLYEALHDYLTNKEIQDFYKRQAINRSDYFKLNHTLKEIENLLDIT